MIKVRRIGHATFETPDLERQIEHFTSVTGLVLAAREKDRALLTTKIGQLAIQLEKGEEPRCAKLAFQVAPGSDFKELEKSLAADGIKSELRSDDLPGTPKLLAFEDNKGTTIEIFTEWDYLTDNQQVIGVGPMKLGHVAFIVRTCRRRPISTAHARLPGVGLERRLLRVHALQSRPPHGEFRAAARSTTCTTSRSSCATSRGREGCDVLSLHQIPIIWGPLRHGPGHNVSIYHRNPDKQVIEFFAELDQVLDEELGYLRSAAVAQAIVRNGRKCGRKGNRSVSGWGPPADGGISPLPR